MMNYVDDFRMVFTRELVVSVAVLLASGFAPVVAQMLHPEGNAARRALLVLNTQYSKLRPPPPLDESGVISLKNALERAHFEVIVRPNLDLATFVKELENYGSRVNSGDVSLFYYSGYVVHDLYNRTYLLPIDFDPEVKSEIDGGRACLFSTLERNLAGKHPYVSMLLVDAGWDTPGFSGSSGLSEPHASSHSWIFASANANGAAHEAKIGGFTRSFAVAISQPGLDLTDIARVVKKEVGEASQGREVPVSWDSDPGKFYFQDPIGIEKMNGRDRLKYVYIPPGTFWMGCASDSDKDCRVEEKPRHLVEITKGYWLGQTEVTNQAYKLFDKKWKPKSHITDAGKQGDIPVVDVSWEDAQKYCQWASNGGRLPTEAEWERAARSGRDGDVYPFDPAVSSEKANFLFRRGADRFPDIAPVMQYDPNDFKLYDMAGNVWEWTLDLFSETYYQVAAKESPIRDPGGPEKTDRIQKHVIRGGSYDSDLKHLRISYREPGAAGGNVVGFRCLLPDTLEVANGFRN